MSIRKRILPSGATSWQADFLDRNGRRKRKQFKTKREATDWLHDQHHAIKTGAYRWEADKKTVAELAKDFIKAMEAREKAGQRMEQSTLTEYKRHIEKRIKDPDIGLGRMKLGDVTRRAVAAFRDDLIGQGVSTAMTRKVITTLRLMFSYGVNQDFIAANPAQGIKVLATTRTKEQVKIPTADEVHTLIAAAGDDFKPYLIAAITTGLRAGEQRALQWGDVDFNAKVIRVRRRVDNKGNMGEPKSAAGVRDVPIGPYTINTLKAWRDRPNKDGVTVKHKDSDLVFPTRTGNPQSATNVRNRKWLPLLEKCGLKFRWHDLRHYAVSSWIAQGFDAKTIQSWAGHSSIGLTYDVYGHLLPKPEHGQAIDDMETRMAKAVETKEEQNVTVLRNGK